MWFIVVVAVVATLLVFGTPTVIIFIISVSLTRRRKGKTYSKLLTTPCCVLMGDPRKPPSRYGFRIFFAGT